MQPRLLPRSSTAFAVACGILLQSCTSLERLGVAQSTPVAFHAAVIQVVDALSYYQTHLRTQTRRLPPIKEAEFNFKIATGTEVGLGADLYVFTLGGSVESTTSHEITYTYKGLPSPQDKLSSDKPALLSELIDTIETVAAAVNESKAFGKKPYQSMKVQVEFGFKLQGEVGVNVPIQLVTIGAHAHYDKSTVQTVTLTFAGPG
jgi:hypothetical protein